MPCFAFQYVGGKLNCLLWRVGMRFVVNRSHRMAGAALCHHIAGAAFTLAALHGNAQFKLDFIKAHTRVGVACYLSVRNPAAYTDDHGCKQLWLAIDTIARL